MRSWEKWDLPGVAEKIQKDWQEDEGENHYKDLVARKALEFIQKGDRILELGCGNGMIYWRIRKREIAYTGLDISFEMIKAAQVAYPGIDFRVGDGYHLEFPDEEFDVVCAFDVLLHLPEIVSFLKEMTRVARKYVLFTLHLGDKTSFGQETILGNRFLFVRYSNEDSTRRVIEGTGRKQIKVTDLEYNRSSFWAVAKG